MKENGFSLKQLSRATNTPFYTITYLRLLGRLPLIKEPTGKGCRAIYHHRCIEILQLYNNR